MLIRDQVYQTIKNDIISGVLLPGETINILDISNRMNISAAPIREALNTLGREGLVELLPYRKAVVAAGTAEDAEISWELRLFIEPYAARRAVNNIPEEALLEAQELVKQSMKEPENLSFRLESDRVTHALLRDYANSNALSSVLDSLQVHTMRYRYLARHQSESPETVLLIAREHMEILNAIALRDENLVYFQVYNHVKNSSQRNRFREISE